MKVFVLCLLLVVSERLCCGAQSPQPAPVVKEQVTVTATRTPLESDVSSVRVLSDSALQEAPALTLDDRLRAVPGLELYRRTSGWVANPTTQGISLRGLGSTAASRTLVISDQVPMNDPFGGWIHWNEIPALAIQSVEILRGGASDLYGSNAMGGVINVIPVHPTIFRRIIQISGGNLGTLSNDGVFTASHHDWSGLGAWSVLRTDGYITVAPEQRGPVDKPAGVDGESGRVEIYRSDAAKSVFLRGNVLNEARGNGTALQTNATRLWRYQTGGDAAMGHSAIWGRVFGSEQHYRQVFSSIPISRVSESLNRQQFVPSQEMGAAGQWATRKESLNFAGGFDMRDVRATDMEIPYSNGVSGVTTSISARQRSTGGYGEFLWQKAGWSAALSGRVDDFRTFDANKHVGSTGTVLARTDEVVFNPRFGLVRTFAYGIGISVSAFRAFRGPTLNELYRNSQVGQQLTLPNDALRSERATGFEAGAHQHIKRVDWRASYFWTEVNRPVSALLISSTPSSQTLQRQNLGQIRSRGVSIDYAVQAWNWLRVIGGYQLAIATVTSFKPDAALIGKWIPEVPRNAATLQLHAEKRQLGTLNVALRQSGRLYDNSANSAVLHGFFRVDVEAERKLFAQFRITASTQNLFDRRVEAGRTPTLTLATPRVMMIGVRWSQ